MTEDQVRWVAHLARLELSAAELHKITEQLSKIVDYVTQLRQVNTDGVEPLAHALDGAAVAWVSGRNHVQQLHWRVLMLRQNVDTASSPSRDAA